MRYSLCSRISRISLGLSAQRTFLRLCDSQRSETGNGRSKRPVPLKAMAFSRASTGLLCASAGGRPSKHPTHTTLCPLQHAATWEQQFINSSCHHTRGGTTGGRLWPVAMWLTKTSALLLLSYHLPLPLADDSDLRSDLHDLREV